MSSANLVLHAYASVAFAAGVPSIADQDGSFSSTVTDNGTGDITLTLNASDGIDASECTVAMNVVGAVAASQLTTFGIVHTSDVAKRITILREGAMGAVSALADVDFEITIFKKLLI